MTIVDIGQGDSILLRDISSKTILIDVGGKVTFGQTDKWRRRISDTNAEKTLIPYLKSRGIDKIDQLVLTHTDTDHMGDMEVVAKAFHVGEVLVSPGSLTKANFVSKLRRMKVKVHITKPGETLSIMGSHLQVLYPLKIGDGGNNDSIVLYGRLLGLNFLFTGDLEKEGEAFLRAKLIIALGWVGASNEIEVLIKQMHSDEDALCRAWSATSLMQMSFHRVNNEVLQEKTRLD